MKLRKLAAMSIAVAAASFAMVSTSALAGAHHTASKNVKCTGISICKNNGCKGQSYVLVSKTACDQLGGTAAKSTTKKSTKVTKTTETTKDSTKDAAKGAKVSDATTGGQTTASVDVAGTQTAANNTTGTEQNQ